MTAQSLSPTSRGAHRFTVTRESDRRIFADAVAAKVLDLEVGEYIHSCGSLHLYEDELDLVEQAQPCKAVTAISPEMTDLCPVATEVYDSWEADLRRNRKDPIHGGSQYWRRVRNEMLGSLHHNAQSLEQR